MRRATPFPSFALPESRSQQRLDRPILSVNAALLLSVIRASSWRERKVSSVYLGRIGGYQWDFEHYYRIESSWQYDGNRCQFTSTRPTIHHTSLFTIQSRVSVVSTLQQIEWRWLFPSSWDWVVILLVLYTGIITPYTISFLSDEDQKRTNLNAHASTRQFNRERTSIHVLVIIDVLIDFMFILDILISFR